jgi:sugar phosphate isomerase/epimerase
MGVRAIEIGIGSASFLDISAASEIDRLQRGLRSSGVRVHSVHAASGSAVDFSSFDDEVHEQGVAALIEAIELAHVLEARFTIVHPSHEVVTTERRRRLDRAAGVIRELVVIAEESDVTLAVKNMPPGFLCDKSEEMIKLIGAAKSSWVGVCFDTGHANLGPSFHDEAGRLLPLTVTCHIHDNDGSGNQRLFPGQGSIDWTRFAELYHTHCPEASLTVKGKLPDGWNWARVSDHLGGLMLKHQAR